jgi:hypothetical protein
MKKWPKKQEFNKCNENLSDWDNTQKIIEAKKTHQINISELPEPPSLEK